MSNHRLSSKAINAFEGPGRLGDGGGLYLQASKTGARSWLFVFRWQGKRPELGLGSFPAVTLASARKKANEARGYLNETPPRNPRDVWRAAAMANIKAQSFGSFATEWMDANLGAFKNAKHRQQWRNTLTTYAAPIWSKPLDAIDTPDVLVCLKPIWSTKSETAKRVQGRIERILSAAKAQGLRSGENPAQWRGHLDSLLVSRRKAKVPHKAMPYGDVPDYLKSLKNRESTSAHALAFLILTATRSGEARGALWSEIDTSQSIWTIPAERMKIPKEHRIPLSAAALEILADMAERRRNAFVFPGLGAGKPINEAALRKLLKATAPGGITQHGFRSAFRDWVGEETSFSREVAELALAHRFGDATERAYRRGDALEKRRALMESWANYCVGNSFSNVVAING